MRKELSEWSRLSRDYGRIDKFKTAEFSEGFNRFRRHDHGVISYVSARHITERWIIPKAINERIQFLL